MAKPLIIGIHGLANKPDEDILKDWWRQSIVEGLRKNEQAGDVEFDFDMAYWAHHLYKNQLHDDPDFSFDKLFNDEPYVEAVEGTLEPRRDSIIDTLAAKTFDLTGETLDVLKARFGVSSLADAFLGKLLKDLDLYYQNESKRVQLRGVLEDKILSHKGRKIMIVAHSMGSIIAYDVLTLLGRRDNPIDVEHLVTIGSPLGLPHVKGKIIQEFTHRGPETERVRTPTVVRNKWVNFADRKDPVALDVHLADDYGENASGVGCEDDLVLNDYRINKPGKKEADRNHHKSYGYLRTPEFSKLAKEFLTG